MLDCTYEDQFEWYSKVLILAEKNVDKANNDADYLATLHEQYYSRLTRYIFVRINDKSEAEDLASEVFLKALQSLKSFRGTRDQMPAWLYKIARNLIVDYIRKEESRRKAQRDITIVNQSEDLEATVETRDRLRKVIEGLKRLTPSQREVLGLRVYSGLKSAEAAKLLGKSPGAVREMQRAAVASLREYMVSVRGGDRHE